MAPHLKSLLRTWSSLHCITLSLYDVRRVFLSPSNKMRSRGRCSNPVFSVKFPAPTRDGSRTRWHPRSCPRLPSSDRTDVHVRTMLAPLAPTFNFWVSRLLMGRMTLSAALRLLPTAPLCLLLSYGSCVILASCFPLAASGIFTQPHTENCALQSI